MNRWATWLSQALVLGIVAWSSGCCCCNPAALRGLSTNRAPATQALSGEEAEELATGTEYAQKALNAKRYGDVLTADLRKDGIYWYVEGTAQGKGGQGTVNYIVMFQVSRFDNHQQWSVQTVSVDGEVVYP